MIIKSKGTYVVCGPYFSALIYVIGTIPHFTIVSGIELDPFIQRGEVVALTKDSIELLMIAEHPDRFVFAPINILGNSSLPGLKKNVKTENVEFNEKNYESWVSYYKELKAFNLPLNRLIARIMFDEKSYMQAEMIVNLIEQKTKIQ